MKREQLIIKNGNGKYNYLDKVYYILIRNKTINVDDKTHHRWSFYNTIMEYLLDLGYENLFEEVKYRLTDAEDPNEVFNNVLDKLEVQSHYVIRLKQTIQNYIDEDFYHIFFQ